MLSICDRIDVRYWEIYMIGDFIRKDGKKGYLIKIFMIMNIWLY